MSRLSPYFILPAFALLAACSGGADRNDGAETIQAETLTVANVIVETAGAVENADADAAPTVADKPAPVANTKSSSATPAAPKAAPKQPPPKATPKVAPAAKPTTESEAPAAGDTCTPEHRAMGHC